MNQFSWLVLALLSFPAFGGRDLECRSIDQTHRPYYQLKMIEKSSRLYRVTLKTTRDLAGEDVREQVFSGSRRMVTKKGFSVVLMNASGRRVAQVVGGRVPRQGEQVAAVLEFLSPKKNSEELTCAVAGSDGDELAELFEKVDSCAGNSNGNMSEFDVDGFTSKKAIQALKKENRDSRGVDCSGAHRYLTGQAAAARFLKMINDRNDEPGSCLLDVLSPEDMKRLRALIGASDHVGLVASVYDSELDKEDNPEACLYYVFDMYRPDGVRMKFEFNYTD